jgi:hypothetical protein
MFLGAESSLCATVWFMRISVSDLTLVYETARLRVPELLPTLRALLRRIEEAGDRS